MQRYSYTLLPARTYAAFVSYATNTQNYLLSYSDISSFPIISKFP